MGGGGAPPFTGLGGAGAGGQVAAVSLPPSQAHPSIQQTAIVINHDNYSEWPPCSDTELQLCTGLGLDTVGTPWRRPDTHL